MEGIVELIIQYGVRIVGVLVVLWVANRGAGWLRGQVADQLTAKKFDATIAKFLGSIAYYAIMVMTVLACLGVFGVETTSFAALIGAAGLAIGLAFQGTLSSVASGVMLVAFRPFKTGQLVEVGGTVGVVDEIGLLTTTIDTPDNVRVIFPNSQVTGGVIKNFHHNKYIRVEIPVGTDYSADLDKTREVLQAAANAMTTRAPDKAPEIFLASLGGSSIDWQVRVWGDPKIYWDIWQEGTRATKIALDKAGIGIPYPQMDVHVDGKLG